MTWLRWVLALMGLVVLGLTQAAEVCPERFPTIPPDGASTRQTLLDELKGLEEVCAQRADFFAWQGVLYLQQKEPQKAANALEKALMLDPDLAGAQLDYAQALAELGEKDAAHRLTQTVMARPDIPQTLHDWLQGQGPLIGNEGWKADWTVQSVLGHETNLNSAPTSNLVTLTLPGGNVPVTLGQNQLPEAGMAFQTTAAVQIQRQWSDSQAQMEMDGTNRTSQDHADSNLQWFDGLAQWSHTLGEQNIGAQLSTTRLWMGGAGLYQENAGKLFVDRPWDRGSLHCRYGTGGEYSLRQYPIDPTLNGIYTGLELGLGCQHHDTVVAATGLWGVDRAQSPLRLGGNQSRDDFALSLTEPMGKGSWIVLGQWSRLSDEQLYSALLGGMTRSIVRRGERVEYDYPLNGQWTILGYLDTLDQTSNLSLFTLSDRALYFGLRWSGKSW